MNPRITARRNFLKKRSSPLTIGFTAIADFTSFIGQEYLAGIMKACEEYGLNFINLASAIRPSLFIDRSFFKQYLSKTAFMHSPLLDGLITWASSLSSYMPNHEIQSLFSSLSPLPMVDIGYLDIPHIPSIRIDNDYSIHLLVEHLVKVHGFSRIAFFGSRFSLPHQLRLQAFKKEMKSFALPVTDDMIFLADSLDEQDVARQVERFRNKFGMTDSLSRPQAILTSSDIIAHHIIEELEKHGISVPDDIAVTGFNNQLAGLTSSSPITTIDLAYFKRGFEAVEILVDKIMGLENTGTHTVPTSLVVRQSCGCFESEILDAQNDELDSKEDFSRKSESEIRRYLEDSIIRHFNNASEKQKSSLAEAILSDIYNTNVPPPIQILTWFRKELSLERNSLHPLISRASMPKNISSLRRIVLPIVQNQNKAYHRMENIFHMLRTLHSVNERYEMISNQVDSSKTSNLMNLALALSSAENTKQLENALRVKLGSLSIPGIILCLSSAFSDDLNSVNIEMVYSDAQNELFPLLPLKVREPSLFPKRFFPKNTPFSVTLTILCHEGKYLGYAYIFMNNENLALYDDLQELLSQNIFRIYLKEGKTNSHSALIPDREKLAESVPFSPDENSPVRGGKLSAENIVDYLLDHIDEMCDLDKMANYFGMSKSYLTRRTKELTGYSTQILHERLKIEQAKNLIKSGKMKMNDIASRLGFSNPNYFSNVFKKVTGVRPTEFAQQSKKR
ncbi:MAG: substrate-binding domain-containing protein [Treponema sp.]|nr:substrate-binding domain-containing protein [Treponema sp.]